MPVHPDTTSAMARLSTAVAASPCSCRIFWSSRRRPAHSRRNASSAPSPAWPSRVSTSASRVIAVCSARQRPTSSSRSSVARARAASSVASRSAWFACRAVSRRRPVISPSSALQHRSASASSVGGVRCAIVARGGAASSIVIAFAGTCGRAMKRRDRRAAAMTRSVMRAFSARALASASASIRLTGMPIRANPTSAMARLPRPVVASPVSASVPSRSSRCPAHSRRRSRK